MNKNAIQKYAIWARNELITQVQQRAYSYGIGENGKYDANALSVGGRALAPKEQEQRRAFIREVERNGYKQAVEEVAYTWFNRFIALRFMEVNDYLPTHIRVLSDDKGEFKPDILKHAHSIELAGLDNAKVSEFINASDTDGLYRCLLLIQCNSLNELLPEMFEKMGAYTEMLLPNNILKPEGVIGRLVNDIPEEDFKDAVQIIGWMYQYYNTEPKQAVFDGLKKNIKITKEKIPAATQLFTPDWIVRYMVENSLGRLWLESHPNSPLKANWKYYLDEAEQTPEVTEHLRALRSENAVGSPEDIKFIDPCMGSGHILVYAFDVLLQIYVSEGYSERDAAKLILEKNLYGLEIDRRAYQLSYFALMMKARQYNRRVLTLDVCPQIYEPTGYANGMEYGSLIRVDVLEPEPVEPTGQMTLGEDYTEKLNTWNYRRLLAQKYDAVVTNPPYMGSSSLSGKMLQYIKNDYPDSKNDLFSVFIERCGQLLKPFGLKAMITQQAWMFQPSYAKLRNKLYLHQIINVSHLGSRAFDEIAGEVVQTVAFVLCNRHIDDYKSVFVRIVEASGEAEKEKVFLARNHIYQVDISILQTIPGKPLAYWVSENMARLFGKDPISKFAISDGQTKTGDNDKYLRNIWEVANTKVGRNKKWSLIAKGGAFRRWAGNINTIIDWSEKARKHYRSDNVARIAPEYIWFRKGVCWNHIGSTVFAARFLQDDTLFETAAPSVFFEDEKLLYYVIGYLNSAVSNELLRFINPTLSTNVGDITVQPLIQNDREYDIIVSLVTINIALSRADWDSFETSWDFKRHPLVPPFRVYDIETNETEMWISAAFESWQEYTNGQFSKLKANEEELNRIFIDIYGLQDELTPEVEDKDVTVCRADLQREIRSLISYAVGCMFGRHSLDTPGLAYAGGEWDAAKYTTVIPDKDNILPICDDEYFDDDIVGRFIKFIEVVYGKGTLEENLRFIADALGGSGTTREVIRKYFLNDFYKDHCKIYQKRPIYWMFDSGKKNGFKALVYLHRYQSDLLARMRTDYVHEQQERYRTQLAHISASLNDVSGSERVKLTKQQSKLTEQSAEIASYEEKLHHFADQNIEIDLDDGVKKNYALFTDIVAKI